MSRVERIDNPSERRDSEQFRQAGPGRTGNRRLNELDPGRTPTKAEGEVDDVEEALRHQSE